MRITVLIGCVSLLLLGCTTINDGKTLKDGAWRVTLDIKADKELPFTATASQGVLTIYNAEETIPIDEISIQGDSITIHPPVFEGIFKGVFSADGTTISGDFIKPSLDRVVPFTMKHGEAFRFGKHHHALISGSGVEEDNTVITGNWETVFSPDAPEDRYIAKGIFHQEGTKVTGTFRTTTGDYRYLEGAMQGDSLKLSTFDGAHAFLFEAKVFKDSLSGTFYSGNHWEEPFTAVRNETYELPDAKDLTYLKEGYDKLTFSFPDAQGTMVSLSDDRFKNKVVLVQIMGTWCPNCLDETKFYLEFLKQHPEYPLEIVALAFEYAPTRQKAFASIERLKKRLNVPYPILLAQYGSENKQKAQEKLPMLNHVLSYPTTVFIDKTGDVRRIHTGYNGPATGKKHEAFKEDFEAFVATLVGE